MDGLDGLVQAPPVKFARESVTAFGLRLRQAREARGLIREEVAESIGIKVQALYNYEQGLRAPSELHLVWSLEDVVGLERGVLARLLGFAPLDGCPPVATIEDAVAAAGELDREARAQLLEAYHQLRTPTA